MPVTREAEEGGHSVQQLGQRSEAVSTKTVLKGLEVSLSGGVPWFNSQYLPTRTQRRIPVLSLQVAWGRLARGAPQASGSRAVKVATAVVAGWVGSAPPCTRGSLVAPAVSPT